MIGDIMGISRLRLGTDGAGVSTLVTFFDCPLRCKYCINNHCHEYSDGVLGLCGTPRGSYTAEELIRILEKDDIYFCMSGGGVTFGGGEPLLQSAFIHEVCRLAKPMWKKRIETSLNVQWHYAELLVDDIDEWIIDIKDMNYMIYKSYTGKGNQQVIDNLFRLRDLVDKSKLHIRVPRIPYYNKEKHVQKSVEEIRRILDVEPEVFDYVMIPVGVNKNQTY